MSQKFIKALGLIALAGLSTLSDAQTAFDPTKWAPAGPIFTAGRSRNIVVDKADPSGQTLWAGSTSSGVFTSTNGGLNWTPLHDQGTVRNISYMAQGADNTIYAATGEGFLRPGPLAKAQVGTGLYKIDMNTRTLVQVAPASVVGTVINRIACSSTNANHIAIAGNKGILLTTDLSNYSAATGIPTGPLLSGQDVEFTTAGKIYCSVGNEKSVPGFVSSHVYKGDINGSFVQITPTSLLALGAPNYGRIELAVAPSNNNVIYASVANKSIPPIGTAIWWSSSNKAIFVSYDGGDNWGTVLIGSPALDPLTNGANLSFGDYAHSIAVNPTNSDMLFVGGYKCMVFSRTGGSNANPTGSWIQLGSSGNPFVSPFYLHENIHDIKIVGSGTTVKFYFVTDAGIFRSSDMGASLASDFMFPPSFQPFYKGLVTGQFNSVSIEAFPSPTGTTVVNNQSQISSNYGYIGGTGGNGLVYFNGTEQNATQEINHASGEIYNAEFSKLLPNAAFFTNGTSGSISRISDIRNGAPDVLSINSYSNPIARITPFSSDFSSDLFLNASGTPFKLWENYGQVSASPDSVVFYNDSVRVQASIQGGVATLTTQTTFTFSSGRAFSSALIDSIAIRTGTVPYDFNASVINIPFAGPDRKDIFIKLQNNYPVAPVGLTTPSISLMTGPVAAASVSLNATTGVDQISVTFNAPAFGTKTAQTAPGSTDPTVYYKVFATIFYKYKVGDTIKIIDNSISTRAQTYEVVLTTPLRWTQTSISGPKPFSDVTNPLQKVATRISARLAFVYKNINTTGTAFPAVVVSRAPLNLNDPLTLVRVSQNGALTEDATGAPTSASISIPGKPILLEWSKSGTELYYATDDNNLYRVSNLGMILDNAPASYSGKLSTDIFRYNFPVTQTVNPNSPYRTTLLGTFTKTITSMSVSKDDQKIVLTFNDPTGTLVMSNTNSLKTSNISNINFVNKSGNLTNLATYCSWIEKDDDKKVLIGTDNGIFYTSDVTASTPVWSNVNNNQLPNVQIFDIKQQTLESWNTYNSGQIFVATNGRGIWTNKSFIAPFVVSIDDRGDELKKENNLSLYPNPTNGEVSLSFSAVDGESAVLNVMDMNGRLIKTESMGELFGQTKYSFNTNELASGLYLVNITSTEGVKRVAKLVVTK